MLKKTVIFYFDIQNFYRQSKSVFSNIKYPNFDPIALSKVVAKRESLKIKEIKLYTGISPKKASPLWHEFWTNKLALVGKHELVKTFSRPTRRRVNEEGEPFYIEKGIDVMIAVDIISDLFDKESEAIVIFSQDQDLSEAVKKAKVIAKKQNRTVSFYSAFPFLSEESSNKMGLRGAYKVKISEDEYNQCIDPRDYRRP